ncbi:MAG: hypothetical protein Q3M30_17390 [Candidatus Electrothrix sp. Rat3]|nr:hypothetical protein [Candidatus Electrothrix rattekaaiensis]
MPDNTTPPTADQLADLISGYTKLKEYFESIQADIDQRLAVISGAKRIACGSTKPGATEWVQYGGDAKTGVYVDIDTSAAQFTKNPVYTTAIGGNSHHWETTGASSVYSATATSFRVYVQWSKRDTPLTPEVTNGYKWHINWIGMEPED